MAIAPDGRVFVAEQQGAIRVIKEDVLLATPFATLEVDAAGERGLVGLAFDPEFASNGYLYVYYTTPSPASHARLSRLTAEGDLVQAGSEVVLLNLPDLEGATIHLGGAIHFGHDGKLYLSVGDNAKPTDAQLLEKLRGKILRLNRDGSIPNDNPFYEQAIGDSRAIWAYGLRNPFTTAFQPATGRFFINDVGQNSWEEINDGYAGANFGWPVTEGDFDASRFPHFTPPLHAYSHHTGCSITGGAFYNPGNAQFPPEFIGKYLFADFCAGWVRLLDPADGSISAFATGLTFPTALQVSSDGSLYYLQRGSTGSPATVPGSVGKIQYNLEGPPIIATAPEDQTVAQGSTVTFSASAASATPVSYKWQRDGIDIPGAQAPNYSFSVVRADDGAEFRVVATNVNGSTTSTAARLTVPEGGPPSVTITSPADGTFYHAGATIAFSGTAQDGEDAVIPSSAYTWRVDFHHDDHLHPFLQSISGATSGNFMTAASGETSVNTFYRIHLEARDSSGLRTSVHRDIFPRIAVAQFLTEPSGLQIKLDGQPLTTPVALEGVVNLMRSMAAFPQLLGSEWYDFDAWSDGGEAEHWFAFPANETTFVASYRRWDGAFISDLTWLTDEQNGWGPPERDRSNGETGAADGGPIMLDGRRYEKGVGVHAPSRIAIALDGSHDRFRSDIGIDDEVGAAGSAVFEVWADGLLLFQGAKMTGNSRTENIDVDVAGKRQLVLIVSDAGDGGMSDHADWANARLERPRPIVSPTPTPAASATPTPSPSEVPPTPSPTASPTPSPTASPTPSPTPSPPAPAPVSRALNISTRAVVPAQGVVIGGFIITGTKSKQVLLRAVAPSLQTAGVAAIEDPMLSLHDATGAVVGENDDWRQTQHAAIEATGIPPLHTREAAMLATLAPGAYTAVLSGKNGSRGIAVVEIYDVGREEASRLANISTRGTVHTADEVMIAGFIVGGESSVNMLIRVLGPSLEQSGVIHPLADPALRLLDRDGQVVRACDDWQEDAAQASEIRALDMAEPQASEPAVIAELPPGLYTVVASGDRGTTGEALVEVYHLEP